jgi:hypothetical protein
VCPAPGCPPEKVDHARLRGLELAAANGNPTFKGYVDEITQKLRAAGAPSLIALVAGCEADLEFGLTGALPLPKVRAMPGEARPVFGRQG